MALILLLTTDDEQPIELPILGKSTIGRSSSCEITINDRQMSGKHGVFELNSNGEIHYTDLGSTNGSFLNNSQITEKTIFRITDTLRLGNTLIAIDEKRLTSRERLSIGRGGIGKEDGTLIVPSMKGSTKSFLKEIAEAKPKEEIKKEIKEEIKPPPKRGVVLNKNLKKKTIKSHIDPSKDESFLEQEASSGKTRFLKLDFFKKKEKKKK